ncbi:hypothetical protein RyT2_22290 [Pseudolactococcus yaeyamensis]
MKKRHLIWVITSLTCFFLLGLGAVFAWQNATQHKTFESETKDSQSSVTLRKYALDEKGEKTQTLLPDVTFRLFKENPAQPDKPTQIGLDYHTDQNGEIFLDNLTVGKYYFEEVRPPFDYDFLADENGKKITRFPFEIKGSEGEHIYLDVYNALLTADLTIQKQVLPPDGLTLSEADKAREFYFTVNFTQNGQSVTDSFTYTIDNVSYTIKSGEKLTLKHGQQAIFKSLPRTIHYEVIEDNAPGYSSQGTNTVGDLSGKPQIVHFTNLKAIGGLKITKRVTNATADQDGRAYEFTIKFSDGKQYHPYIGDKQVKLTDKDQFYLKADETAYFADLPNGVTYTVTETPYADYVTDFSTIQGTIITGKIASHVVTNNFKAISPDDKGDLVIQKLVTGQGNAKDSFSFKVTLSTDKSYELIIMTGTLTQVLSIKSGDTIKLTAGASAMIKALPLGTSYQVEEVDPGDYHPATRTISGTISDEKQAVVVTFENIAPPKLTVIKKVVAPSSADANKTFEFKLIITGRADQLFTLRGDESKTFTLPYGASYQLIETNYEKDGYQLTSFENDSRDQVTQDVTAIATNTYFGEEEVDISGEKTWSIPKGIQLPDKITVQLLDESGTVIEEKVVQVSADGKWLYQFKAPKYDATGHEINYQIREVGIPHFESQVTGYDILNTYVNPTSLTPKVEKKLTGNLPEKNEKFDFVLTSIHQKPTETQTVSISGAGVANFKALNFDKAGEYVYHIYEKTGSLTGYIYDRTTYTLTIKIEKEGQALKVVSAVYSQPDGQVSEWAIFTNHYEEATPPSTSPPPSSTRPPSSSTPPSTPPSSQQPPVERLPRTDVPSGLLPETGDAVTFGSILFGLAVLTLVYRRWLKSRRK